jgi:hypothetical protein
LSRRDPHSVCSALFVLPQDVTSNTGPVNDRSDAWSASSGGHDSTPPDACLHMISTAGAAVPGPFLIYVVQRYSCPSAPFSKSCYISSPGYSTPQNYDNSYSFLPEHEPFSMASWLRERFPQVQPCSRWRFPWGY